MKNKKKLKFKKFYFHPITTYLIMILIIVIFSGILSLFQMQATYDTINKNTIELTPTLVVVKNLLSFEGLKYLISNTLKNFISFAPLGSLIISLIGISIAEGTKLIETLTKKLSKKISKKTLTFIVLFLATISSLINDVGYVVLIPLAALVYFINERNPILGIVTAFCGVSFGYGVSIFIGTTDVTLVEYTKLAAKLISENSHIPLTSNLIFIIITSVLLSIVGTIIIEKIIAPKIGKYKAEDEMSKTQKYEVFNLEEMEQQLLDDEKHEKTGLRYALISAIILLLLSIYSLIPNLPGSGLLLDMTEKTYLNQLFGKNSYFQDGFTYIISLFMIIPGIAYGLGAKTIPNDKQLIERINNSFSKSSSLFILIFVASQFISIFKKTNIGTIITAWLANVLNVLNISGIPLILLVIILIGISNIFLTSSTTKWEIFSPVVVPMLAQSNISPAFAQIIMRAGDSITNGITPILASFVIFIGYLNLYNLNKNKPYTIKKAISLVMPYFLLISLAWILIIIGWYILKLPIGINVYPTL